MAILLEKGKHASNTAWICSLQLNENRTVGIDQVCGHIYQKNEGRRDACWTMGACMPTIDMCLCECKGMSICACVCAHIFDSCLV